MPPPRSTPDFAGETNKNRPRPKKGRFFIRSVSAQPFTGTHQKMRQDGVVLHDFESELPQFVTRRLGLSRPRGRRRSREAGCAGGDVEADKR